MSRFKRAAQLRQRRSIAAMNRASIDAHLKSNGINLPNQIKSNTVTTPKLLGEVIKRGGK